MTIDDFIEQYAPDMCGASWRRWREILRGTKPENFWVIGRGGGKSRAAGVKLAHSASRDWPHAPGETVVAACFASDRRQARIVFQYAKAAVPPELIETEKAESLVLRNGNLLEVVTASTATSRGRTFCLVVCDEIAHWNTDESGSDADVEVIRAIRPGLARCPGSELVCISTPWARRGVLWRAAQQWGASGGDEFHSYITASTRELNPTFSEREIERAVEEDPASARCEYFAEFRSDVETLLAPDLADQALEHRGDLGWQDGRHYVAWADPSGGSSDSFALGIAHAENAMIIVDAVAEARPPFSPDEVVERFAGLLKRYGLSRVTADRFGGEWVRERFRAHGIHCATAEKSASDLYRELVPLFNDGRIRIPDANPRLRSQLLALERTVSRGGRELISHPPGPHSHDDLANIVAGCASLVSDSLRHITQPRVVWGAPAEKQVPDGVDHKGREWRGGRPWSGVFVEATQFGAHGMPLELPPKYEEGRRIELTEAERAHFIANPPRPQRRQKVVWG